jgi:hypothetical protein
LIVEGALSVMKMCGSFFGIQSIFLSNGDSLA